MVNYKISDSWYNSSLRNCQASDKISVSWFLGTWKVGGVDMQCDIVTINRAELAQDWNPLTAKDYWDSSSVGMYFIVNYPGYNPKCKIPIS